VRRPKQLDKFLVIGPVRRMVEAEIVHVQLKAAVPLDGDQLVDLVEVFRVSEGGQDDIIEHRQQHPRLPHPMVWAICFQRSQS
jgi:hypothetical protein